MHRFMAGPVPMSATIELIGSMGADAKCAFVIEDDFSKKLKVNAVDEVKELSCAGCHIHLESQVDDTFSHC